MFARRRPLLPRLAGDGASVTVHTVDDRSVQGDPRRRLPGHLALRHARYLLDGGAEEELEGDVLVPRAAIAFVQAEPGG